MQRVNNLKPVSSGATSRSPGKRARRVAPDFIAGHEPFSRRPPLALVPCDGRGRHRGSRQRPLMPSIMAISFRIHRDKEI